MGCATSHPLEFLLKRNFRNCYHLLFLKLRIFFIAADSNKEEISYILLMPVLSSNIIKT